MSSTEAILDSSRPELLDLSTRNRLLSIPQNHGRARIVHVDDELSDNVFQILVHERKSMSFRPITVSGQPTVDDDVDDDEAVQLDPGRHRDRFLQTKYTADSLSSKLLGLYRDAQTIMEEQGVNVLHLALGNLIWFDADASDIPRYAPLILIPVDLIRKKAGNKFTLKWREEDLEENLTLRMKLMELGLELPKFPNEEELVPSTYLGAVARLIAQKPRWEVELNGISLAFFQFSKLLMYRDLDPKNWPDAGQLLENANLTAIVDGFQTNEEPFSEDSNLDRLIPASKLDHVVEADSSQTVAIEMARQGRSMVIQGPPGTGKSQTITNLIASAVLDGKSVLFVAEKLTALQVVKRRLDNEGLGSICLELHSRKATKRTVLDEIERTWHLGRPTEEVSEVLVEKLEQVRSKLNAHAELVHAKTDEPHGLSAYKVIGQLALLHDKGIVEGELSLEGALEWGRSAVQERRDLAGAMTARLAGMEPPPTHPWRGVGKTAILNIDIPPIKSSLKKLSNALAELQEVAHSLSKLLHLPPASTFATCSLQLKFAEFMSGAPHVDQQAFGHTVWDSRHAAIVQLVKEGAKLAELTRSYAEVFSGSAFEQDLLPIRKALAQHGTSAFRVLNKEYRHAVSTLKAVLTEKPPAGHKARLLLLDEQEAGRKLYQEIQNSTDLGRNAFGSNWAGATSDWTQLQRIVDWDERINAAQLGFDFRSAFAGLDIHAQRDPVVRDVGSKYQQAQTLLSTFCSELSVDPKTTFGSSSMQDASLAKVQVVIDVWHDRVDDLAGWSAWNTQKRKAIELGIGSVTVAAEEGRLAGKDVPDAFNRAYLSLVLRQVLNSSPTLGQFDGVEHDRVIEEFRGIDKERMTLAKYRVLKAHHSHMPERIAVGATGLVMSEIKRQRGQKPIRKLLRAAGSVVQKIKPVFMMSPLSVAQFLEPGGVEFDLLIVDEASQVRPIDALGAMIRCKQLVVVGDSKQLPPTSFFNKMNENDSDEPDDEDGEQTAQPKDMESVLDLCTTRGLRDTMLNWHYRSRHESLIAVSNHEYYKDELFIVPSSKPKSATLGLKFNFVEDATYDRGCTATNLKEAEAVCDAVIEHARNFPERSLGVVAFSVKQQEMILSVLDKRLKSDSFRDVEDFRNDNERTEPFFVKNLESVQGDERDVIFISVGYGPSTSGKMTMNFGPLSSEGGQRRLNVLISRAKFQCQVFASFHHSDIDLTRSNAEGVRGLKSFLQYAETGNLELPTKSGRGFDSPFEIAVCNAVRTLGYVVEPQVGLAGFFIDLAVVDPSKPGNYLLGIECDGATYHSSRSARERDRLREAVLNGHGWKIHRVWSTDWFQRREEQVRKIKTAIEEAMNEAEPGPTEKKEADTPPPVIQREEFNPEAEEFTSTHSTPYVEASFWVDQNQEPHEVSSNAMMDIVRRIIVLESPIHEQEVVSRVRDLWGKRRAGSRIDKCVKDAIERVRLSSFCKYSDRCLYMPEQVIPVRNRSDVTSTSLRKLELLPPIEIQQAIREVVKASHGADSEELITSVARLLGFSNTSAGLSKVITEQVENMVRSRKLTETDRILNGAS